jgi:hypothetical protein
MKLPKCNLDLKNKKKMKGKYVAYASLTVLM